MQKTFCNMRFEAKMAQKMSLVAFRVVMPWIPMFQMNVLLSC